LSQNAFGGRALPGPLGKLECSPSPIAVKQTALPAKLLANRERSVGRERMGKERTGREKERKG